MFHKHVLTKRAVKLMERDRPLPLDLYAALIGYGVDVTELDRLHRP